MTEINSGFSRDLRGQLVERLAAVEEQLLDTNRERLAIELLGNRSGLIDAHRWAALCGAQVTANVDAALALLDEALELLGRTSADRAGASVGLVDAGTLDLAVECGRLHEKLGDVECGNLEGALDELTAGAPESPPIAALRWLVSTASDSVIAALRAAANACVLLGAER